MGYRYFPATYRLPRAKVFMNFPWKIPDPELGTVNVMVFVESFHVKE